MEPKEPVSLNRMSANSDSDHLHPKEQVTKSKGHCAIKEKPCRLSLPRAFGVHKLLSDTHIARKNCSREGKRTLRQVRVYIVQMADGGEF